PAGLRTPASPWSSYASLAAEDARVIDLRGLVLYLASFAVVAAVMARSLTRPHGDDFGDGLAVVVLPSPSKRNHLRTGILLGVVGAFVVAYLGFRSPKVDEVYRSLVAAIARLVVAADARVLRTPFPLPRSTARRVAPGRPRSDAVVPWTVLVGVTGAGVALAVYGFSPYIPPSLWVLLAGYCVFPVFLLSGRVIL